MLMNEMVDHGENANSAMFAEFTDLGRTDESIATGTASNPTGRYPFHFHDIGTDPDSPPNMVQGISVAGSPGWGIVQHSTDATIMDSIVYDTVGAGIVSEAGDETGMWMRNLVTSVAGTKMDEHLVGVEGAAFENQSRVIIQQGNIAANAVIGWNWFGVEEFPEDADNPSAPNDGIHRAMFDRSQVPFDPSPFDVALDHEEPPITDFNDNISIANDVGLRVFHRQFSDDTDTMSVFRNFTIWGGQDAVALDNYASNYEFIDSVWQGSGTGFAIMRKTSSVVFNNVDMHDFDTGYRSWGVNHEVVLIDTEFHDVAKEFDLDDLLRNVSSSSVRSDLISYYKNSHGIDYTNPMPLIVKSADLTPVKAVTFKADSSADLTIGKGDNGLNITGTITDSVGVRNFNEYVIAKPPNGNGSSKDFEGITLTLGAMSNGELKDFTLDMFLELHGVIKTADGTWVSPVVNWITDRLTGDQHPVIIEIKIVNMTDADLKPYVLKAYPDPGINNARWFADNAVAQSNPTNHSDAADTTAPDNGTDTTTTNNGTDTTATNNGTDTTATNNGTDTTATDNGTDTTTTNNGTDTTTTNNGTGTTATNNGTDTTAPDNGTDTVGVGEILAISDGIFVPKATIVGTGASETLKGGSGQNVIAGLAGDDMIRGRGGNDWLLGGNGSDTLVGDAGNDTLMGGADKDHLFGGDGADIFLFDQSSLDGTVDEIKDFDASQGDVIQLVDFIPTGLSAGDLSGYLWVNSVGSLDILQYDATGTGSDFTDLVTIRNGAKASIPDMIKDGALVLTSSSSDGGQQAETVGSTGGTDTVETGTTDTVETGTADTVENANDANTVDSGAGVETPFPVATVSGSEGADNVRGGNAGDVLAGLGGNDILRGRGGDDWLFGNQGNDTLIGDNGDDSLFGGEGEDNLFGDVGADFFFFSRASLDGSVDDIKDFDASEGDVIALLDLVPSFVSGADIAGYLNIDKQGTVGVLEYDATGTGTSFIDIAKIRDGGQFSVAEMIADGELMIADSSDFFL
jgi:Ca2+-binding RTX toxin-like protein